VEPGGTRNPSASAALALGIVALPATLVAPLAFWLTLGPPWYEVYGWPATWFQKIGVWVVAVLPGLLALVLGLLALRRSRSREGSGSGRAWVGIVMGALCLVTVGFVAVLGVVVSQRDSGPPGVDLPIVTVRSCTADRATGVVTAELEVRSTDRLRGQATVYVGFQPDSGRGFWRNSGYREFDATSGVIPPKGVRTMRVTGTVMKGSDVTCKISRDIGWYTEVASRD
jgi:hypothetical protein